MKKTLTALTMSLSLTHLGAEAANISIVSSVVRIYSQVVEATVPSYFMGAYKAQNGSNFLLELVPKGQSVDTWLEMITYTGLEDAANRNIDSRNLVSSIGAGYKNACPNAFSAKKILEETKKIAYVFSCGNNGQENSETALVLALDGAKDAYTVQWAERGSMSNLPIEIELNKWAQRLKLLNVKLLDAR